MSIYVGIRILNLLVCEELLGDDLSALMEELNGGIILKMELSEISLMMESGIGFSENSVSVSWNDSAGSDDLVDVVFNILVRNGGTLFLDELEEPLEDFLVSKSVEGTSETVNTSGV